MYKKQSWVIALIIIVVIVGGYLLLNNNAPKKPAATQKSEMPKAAKYNVPVQNVTVTKSGFEPQSVSIKTGTTVIWTNKSGGEVTVNSDNHPTNKLWPFLNLGKFGNNASISVVFKTAGTYTYHNYLNPDQKGTVIVK